jgi:glucodextranase-like protein
MTSSRGRTAHVRRRPPSTGRPVKSVKAARPATQRVRQHRGLDGRRRRLPLPTRLLLALSVAALGLAVFLTATGGLGPIVGTLGAGFANAINRLVATPVPTESIVVATNSPIISRPEQAYTNERQLTLRITVPNDVVGDQDAKIRIYLALKGLKAAPIQDVEIGGSATNLVTVDLTKGQNDFTATIIRSGVESESSPVVTVFLDQDAPKVTIKAPKDASTVDTPDVTITGTTEPKATLTARNDANAASVTVAANTDGTFQILLPLESGANTIHIDATDLAGNTSATDLTYTQGSGQMTANLSASTYLISISHPPSQLRVTVIVHDPAGAPLAGATAAFTITIPGLLPISGTAVTGADGRASFSTPLIGKMNVGGGQVVVLVTNAVFGSTTDRVALTFVK